MMKSAMQRDSDGDTHSSQMIEVTIPDKNDDCEVPDLAQMEC